MEVIVALIRLIYHDAASIGLELEVADAVKFYILHYVGKHPLDEDGAYFARVVFLAAQPLGYIPYKCRRSRVVRVDFNLMGTGLCCQSSAHILIASQSFSNSPLS